MNSIPIDDHKLYSLLGDNIRAWRKKSKLTQHQLAEILDLERTSITNIEKGVQKASLAVLYRICFHFGLRIEELLPPVADVVTQNITHTKEEEVTIGKKTASVHSKTAAAIRKLTSNS